MKKIKFPKVKKVSKSKIKKKAWDVFSLYIRTKNIDTMSKLIPCFTCDKMRPLKQMSAGHAIGGRNNAILFDERIVRPQCAGCNIFGRGQYQIFAYKLIKELGMGVFEKILEQSHIPVQYKTSDYQEIYEKYGRKLEKLWNT